MTANRKILHAAAAVGFWTAWVKVASVAKEMIVAKTFGTSDDLDAFLIAFLLPSYVIGVIAGSLSPALVPVLVEARQNRDTDSAEYSFRAIWGLSMLALTTATVLVAAIGASCLPFFCVGFSQEKVALTTHLFYLIVPTVVLGGLTTSLEALLNSLERFAIAAIAPIAVPVSICAALAVSSKTSAQANTLVIGTLGGMLLQLLLLCIAAQRCGFSLYPRKLRRREPVVGRVIRQYLPALAGGVLMGSTVVIDQSMAASLVAGSVSALNYATKITSLTLSIGTMALGTALLPFFSKMIADKDWTAVRNTLRYYKRFIIAVTVPISLTLFALSKPIVAALFQRGSFTDTDTILVAQVQAVLALQIPFFTLGILFIRVISSLQANHILMWGTLLSCTSNVVMNYLFMRLLGVAGIALSTTLVYVISCAFLYYMMERALRRHMAVEPSALTLDN